MTEPATACPDAPRRRSVAGLSVVVICFALAAILASGLVLTIAVGQANKQSKAAQAQAVQNRQAITLVQQVVAKAVAKNNHKWCQTFSTILTFPRQPGQPVTPTPGQIRFAKALIQLSGDYGCPTPGGNR